MTKDARQRRERVEVLLALSLDSEAPRGPDPTVEEIAALFDGTLDETRRREVLSHVARTERAYELWSALADARELAQPATPAEPTPGRVAGWLAELRRRWVLGGLGGVLVASALAALLLLRMPGPLGDLDRELESTYAMAARQLTAADLPERWPLAGVSPKGGLDVLTPDEVRVAEERADTAFSAGVRRGLARAGLATTFWNGIREALPSAPIPCDPEAGASCEEVNRALEALGRWAALTHVVCSQAPPPGSELWSRQGRALARFRTLLADLPGTADYRAWVDQHAAVLDEAEPGRHAVCADVDALLILGLGG